MKKYVTVCVSQKLYKEETPFIVSHRKIWHHWLLKNNREIFMGSLVLCGRLKNVLCDWLMLSLACIGISWWISLAYFGSIIITCREGGDLTRMHWLGKPSSYLSNRCVDREWFYLMINHFLLTFIFLLAFNIFLSDLIVVLLGLVGERAHLWVLGQF